MVVCIVQCEFPSHFSALSGSFNLFTDLVDNCICDARLLAYV